MYKAKVWFNDGNMEYAFISAYTEAEAEMTAVEEFFDKHVDHVELERISDAPKMVVVPFDVYDMIEY